MLDNISAEGIKGHLSASDSFEIEILETVDSTNRVAADRIAQGCGQWYTVVAKSQTDGRGRLGRSFFSPGETGLYMSTVLYPPAEHIGLVTGTAAVAVCEALESEFGIHPKIKWVNDILADEKKVCGILAKGICTKNGTAVILGIGINVYSPEGGFPEDILSVAGALFEKRDEGIRERVAAAVLRALCRRYETMGKDNAPEEYRKRCLTVGRPVRVVPAGNEGGAREATALSVDDSYRITVEYENGQRETLSSGEVSVKL